MKAQGASGLLRKDGDEGRSSVCWDGDGRVCAGGSDDC